METPCGDVILVAAAQDKLKEKGLPDVDETAVVEDVKRIQNHPLVPKSIHVCGCLYDVRTGQLKEIGETTKEGPGGSLGEGLTDAGDLGSGGISEAA